MLFLLKFNSYLIIFTRLIYKYYKKRFIKLEEVYYTYYKIGLYIYINSLN